MSPLDVAVSLAELAYTLSKGSLGLIILALLFILGIALHRLNMNRIYRKVAYTSGGESSKENAFRISKEELYEEMLLPQGSNFNAAAVSAWMLFFGALASYYFLTPGIFLQHNYFQIADLASSPLGFSIFGSVWLLLTVIFAIYLPKQLYGYYEISKNTKLAIMLSVPVLISSIVISAYQSTIYPHIDLGLRTVSFLALLFSLMVLLWPTYVDAMEATR
jgi:hypothetical protein